MECATLREAIDMLARAGAPGAKAFELVAQAVAKGLGCRWAGVASLTQDGERIVTLAACDGAGTLPFDETAVAGAAASALYRAGASESCIFHGDVSARFPADALLRGRRVGFFAAARFHDEAGNPAGHVFAMDSRERKFGADEESDVCRFLEIAGARAGAEFRALRLAEAAPGISGIRSRFSGGPHVISWEMEPSLQSLSYISPLAETVLGYPCESWYRAGAWIERVHPMDRVRAMAALSLAKSGEQGNEFEFRMIAEDGQEVWLCGVVAHSDGATCLDGLWIDLTRQKAIQRELSANVQRFRDFAEADTDWFW